MRKPLMAVPLIGMGYAIAVTPSLWQALVYAIPIFSLCLLIMIIREMLKGKDDG